MDGHRAKVDPGVSSQIVRKQDKGIRSSSQTSTYVTLSCKSLVILQEVPLEDQMALSRILPSCKFTCEVTYSRLYSPTTYRPRFLSKEFFKLEHSYIFGVCGGIVGNNVMHIQNIVQSILLLFLQLESIVLFQLNNSNLHNAHTALRNV